MIKKYNTFIKESLKDKLKGKNFDDIIKNLGNNYNKILLKSIEYNYMDGVRYAIDNGANIYYNDGMLMVIAITFNNLDAIKILLDLDYEYFSEEISNSLYLMKECNYDVVEYLLENFEFDDYQIDQTIKYLKYFSSRKDVLELFKKYKSEHIYDNDDENLKYFFDNDDYINFKKTINKNNYSKGLIDDIFLISCENDRTKYVEYLLQRKLADINTKDGAPMRNACYYGNLDVVKILIKYGVKPTKEHANIAESHFHSNISDYILKYLNKINESLKDKLKGKSESEILNNVKDLTPEKKIEKGAEYGILSLVKQGIKEGADPSDSDNYVISLASEEGHLDVVKELMKDKRVDPSDLNNEPLRFSSLLGYYDIVKELLKDKRVDPSSGDNFAIRYASKNGHLDVVKELLKDKRVDPSDLNNYAIRAASEFGYLNIVKELLKNKKIRNKLSKEELNKYEKQIGDLNESLKDKLKGKSENEILSNVKNLTPEEKLLKGAEYGILSLIKQAIKEGVDPSYDNNYAIYNASEFGHLDIVKYLLKNKRVDPSDYNNEAIRTSSLKGHLDVVKELMKDDRVDPSDYNNDAIRYASQNGHLNVVKELLKDKRVNPSDENNYAIRFASSNEHLDVVKELLKDKRVDPSDYNNYAIRSASRYGHLDVVKELMKDKRVDPSTKNNDAIKFAFKYGHLDIVKYLLKDEKVDPSTGNNFAIRYASYYDHLDIVKELLKDERVRNKLSKEELNKYKKQVNLN